MQYQCPSCGAPIAFKSSISIYTTCQTCLSTVVRHDVNLETLGKVSNLLTDMSPFQIGTSGKFEGRAFELIGRLKVVYDGGTWSEWYAWFNDGQEGWLSEAQGHYSMSFQVPEDTLPEKSRFKVGEKVTINGTKFEVDDMRKVKYSATEGELPFVVHLGYDAYSIDLSSSGKKFANLLIDKEQRQGFVGEYVPFEDFDFKHLKELDGWPGL